MNIIDKLKDIFWSIFKPYPKEILAEWHDLRALYNRTDWTDKEAIKIYMQKDLEFRRKAREFRQK